VFKKYSKIKLKQFKVELEDLLERLGYSVIYGRGDFKEGSCLIENEKKIVVNQFTPLDLQVSFLINVIEKLDLSSIYILPALRRAILEYQR